MKMRPDFASGSMPRSFLSSVTASSAAARLAALKGAELARARRTLSGHGFSNRPRSSLSLRMRRTAWSMRDIGMLPSRTREMSVSASDTSYGTMLMSTPASVAMRTASRRDDATWCTVYSLSMSAQSLTTTPLNPSSVRSRSVRISWLLCTGTPLMSPELIIIVLSPRRWPRGTREEVLAQLPVGDPRRRAILSAQRHAVAEKVFAGGGDEERARAARLAPDCVNSESSAGRGSACSPSTASRPSTLAR